MRPRGFALFVAVLVAPVLGAVSPRVTFERVLPAPHDLGAAEEIALVQAVGDSPKIASFVDHFLHQTNRSGMLRLRDMRGRTEPADAFLAVRSFRCTTEPRGAEESVYDVDGKRVKRRQVWVEASCSGRMEVLTASGARSSFAIKGEGSSAHVGELTDEEREDALEHAARYAALDAAEKITPRRVRESIILDDTAPAFEEGLAMIEAERLAEARKLWEEAMARQPRSAALHYNLAAVCEALGDRKAAEQHYIAARELAPRETRYASELKLFQRRKP